MSRSQMAAVRAMVLASFCALAVACAGGTVGSARTHDAGQVSGSPAPTSKASPAPQGAVARSTVPLSSSGGSTAKPVAVSPGAAGGTAAPPRLPAAYQVIEQNGRSVGDTASFEPASLTIRSGDSVTWSIGGLFGCAESPHSLTSTSANWSVDVSMSCGSAQPGSETSYTYTFTRPGIYTYDDKYATGASGQVIVQA